MKIKFLEQTIECKKVVKGKDYIEVYNEDLDNPICSFNGISDFSLFELIDGEWSYPCKKNEEILQAKIDYISMMTGIEMEI